MNGGSNQHSEFMQNRKEDMLYLKTELLWTYAEIGEKWGVCPQRVQQIIGKHGDVQGKRNKLIVEKHIHLPIDEIVKKTGLSENYIRRLHPELRLPIKNEDCSLAIGVKWENFARDDLGRRGFSPKLMPHGHEYDLYINGIVRVDVKAAITPKESPSSRAVSPVWRFSVGKGKKYRTRCDFYYCVTANKDVFIIPSRDIPHHRYLVTFCFPTLRPELSRWQHYHDRYDLISKRIEEKERGKVTAGAGGQ